jgi:hypothetical protein
MRGCQIPGQQQQCGAQCRSVRELVVLRVEPQWSWGQWAWKLERTERMQLFSGKRKEVPIPIGQPETQQSTVKDR